MSLYQERILPHLLNLAMRNRQLAAYRGRVVPAAAGRVLEVGLGSGLNLPYYGDTVEQLIGLEPSPRLLAMARRRMGGGMRHLVLLDASAEAIPLDRASVDTVVTTWTLCTIPDALQALAEMRRVLRPGGRLLFVEHGQSPDRGVAGWQNRLTPAWKRIAGGCHLNRPVATLIETSGFRIERLDTGYSRGPRVLTYMYEGAARLQ